MPLNSPILLREHLIINLQRRLMPVCVQCSAPTPALYVSYGPSHLVCTRCESCKAFADPYVEYEPIIVAIDLILVKPRAYRHVLFNRAGGETSKKGKRTLEATTDGLRWTTLGRHCLAMLFVDAYLRWYHLCARQRLGREGQEGALLWSYIRIAASTGLLMAALHVTVTVASIVYHRTLKIARAKDLVHADQHDLDRFAAQQVSSSLLLSNVTPTFLLALLLLWQQPSRTGTATSNVWRWDESNIDWVIRSLVSGLSAGVALGVVLPLQRTKIGALAATSILVAGWYVQFTTSQLLQIPFHSGVGVLQTEAGRLAAANYCQAS